MIRRVSFAAGKAILDEQPESVLLDVREEEEYITGHARGALLLPLGQIDAESAAAAIPSPDTPVLLYCRSGIRSRSAAKLLSALGYTQLYDLGSLIGWPYGLE